MGTSRSGWFRTEAEKTRALWAGALLAVIGGYWYMTREPVSARLLSLSVAGRRDCRWVGLLKAARDTCPREALVTSDYPPLGALLTLCLSHVRRAPVRSTRRSSTAGKERRRRTRRLRTNEPRAPLSSTLASPVRSLYLLPSPLGRCWDRRKGAVKVFAWRRRYNCRETRPLFRASRLQSLLRSHSPLHSCTHPIALNAREKLANRASSACDS